MNRSSDLFPIVFVVCSLMGAVAIIVLKLLAVNQFFVTACPITIMLVYAGYYYSKQPSQLNIVGDNLYYLGFLYTLVSLAISLFEFSPNDEAIRTITPIITNFGIAIFSTIFGIAFRVFFNLMHKDPEEAVSDFSATVLRLSKRVSDLDIELGKFSSFRIELEQILREGFNRQKEAIDQVLQHGLYQFKTSVIHFTETVDEANKTLEEGREKFQASLDSALEKAQVSSVAVSASVSGLVGKINSMQVPEDLLEQLLHPSIQRIEAVVADFGNTVSSFNERVSVDLDSALERMQVSSVAVSASVSGLVGKINSMQVPEDLLEQLLHPSIQRIEAVVADFGNTVSSSNERVSADLDSALERMQVSSVAVSASVSDLVGKINSMQVPADLLEQRLHPPIQQIETVVADFGNTVFGLNERVSDLDSALERMQVSSAAVSASVSDLVGKINSMQVPDGSLKQLPHPPVQRIETGTERTAGETQAEDRTNQHGNP